MSEDKMSGEVTINSGCVTTFSFRMNGYQGDMEMSNVAEGLEFLSSRIRGAGAERLKLTTARGVFSV